LPNTELPRETIIEENIITEIPKILERLGTFDSILLVMGKKTRKITGKKILDTLADKGYKLNSVYVQKASHRILERIMKQTKTLNVDLVFGIGGGKNIDMAKALAHFLNIPYISIPTVLSHDGIASDRSVISRGKKKYPILSKPPLAVIADLEILSQAPFRYFASGCGDVISKRTSVLDWQLARDEKGEAYDEEAADLASVSADLIISNAKNYKKDFKTSVRLLTKALINCGFAMQISKSSRPCSGSEHMFCHTLNFLYPKNKALHGEKVALGTYIMSFLHGIDHKEIRNVLKSYKLPVNNKQIKIPKTVLVKALSTAHEIRSDKRYTILKDGIEKNKAKKILKKLKVI